MAATGRTSRSRCTATHVLSGTPPGSYAIVRYFVLFVIHLKTRRVHVAGIAHQVYGKWVEQVARNLTDPVDGFLKDMRYLIHDRDPVFTKHFTDILASTGMKTLKLPPGSPNLNAFAERFVRSIRDECLRRIVPLGEMHLRSLLVVAREPSDG
jgi:putative transposase